MESKALENYETEGKSLDQSIQKDQKPLLTKEINMEKNQVMADGHEEEKNNNIETALLDITLSDLMVGYHPRKNMGDIESLQGSIIRDGLQEPLLVYEDGQGNFVVIDGYRRLTAISELGWKTIPCLIKTGITADQAAHLSFVKNMERKRLDPIEIALHIKAMRDEFGYTFKELEMKGYGSSATISNRLKLLDLPDVVKKNIQDGKITAAHGSHLIKLRTEDEQERWLKRIIDDDLTAKRTRIQIERYLDKGKNKDSQSKVKLVPSDEIPGVYIKDARNMSELPDKSVHLIVSSPPYNVGLEYEKGVSFDEHLLMVKDVLMECARVLTPGGIMALNVGDINNFKGRNGKNDFSQVQLMGYFYQSYLRKHQIFLTDRIIWKKSLNWKKRPDVSFSEKTVHTSYRILNNFEPVYIFRKTGERSLPSEDIILRSKLTKEQWVAWVPGVWEIEPVSSQEEHPAVYPDGLPRRLIKMFSYETDLVLDPWLGSGTTVKVARELNRKAVGYEKEPQYKEVIMKKLGVIPENAGDNAVEAMTEDIEMIKESEVERQGADVVPIRVDAVNKEAAVGVADDYFEMNEMERM